VSEQRLAEAVAHHQAGRLDEAARLYQAVLEDDPAQCDALNLLGVIAQQQGDPDRAIALLSRALAVRENVPDFHNNIGEAYRARGDLDQAIQHYRRATDLEPTNADAHSNLGVALKTKGALEAAEAHLRRAIEIRPAHSRAHSNLGTVQRALGQTEAAMASLSRAIELDPASADAYSNLGNVLGDLDRDGDAIALYRKALEFDPNHGEALLNLGTALKRAGADIADSTAHYRQAVAAHPEIADAHFNLAVNLVERAGYDEARQEYRATIAIDPDHIAAQGNLARLDLLRGRFADGFDRWHWRWREPATWVRTLDHPRWRGESLAGRTLLVWGEQGVGDEVMLASVLGEAIAAAGHVIVELDARLVPLFERSFPDATFVARNEPPLSRIAADDIDVQCALGDLCRWLRRDAEGFATPSAYLQADADAVEAVRVRYGALGPGLKIGIAWRSKPRSDTPENVRFSESKSTALERWRPILTNPDVHFVNLQYGDCADELAAVKDQFGVTVHVDASVDQMTSLDDFAAQIAALDMVVAASNTTVHVAGAQGRPVWTMLPYVPDWRWQLRREDTLWYPAMRLYRQPAVGDWESVFARVGADLAARA
jgi:tetratricopeptide (TPR) repeat protein